MPKQVKVLLIAGVIAFIGYSLAMTYRYEPVSGVGTNGNITVWDRWQNRVCIVGIAIGNKPLCSVEELNSPPLTIKFKDE